MTDPREMVDAARRRLADAGVPLDALGAYATPGRIFRRAPRVRRVGAAWRLGVLLLAEDGRVLSVGEVVRATDPGRRGYAAESARDRAEQRAAALRGDFAEGEVVHVGWHEVDLDAVAAGAASGPLSGRDGTVAVRWSAAGGFMPLEAYLADRVALALDPPAGAS